MRQIVVGGVPLMVREGPSARWDEGVAGEVITGDCYRIGGWSPPNPVRILDVGGHIGCFSAWTARRLANAKIWAFEMMPDNFAVLTQNVGQLPNVTATMAALGDRDGRVQIVRATDNTGGNHAAWSAEQGDDTVACLDVATIFDADGWAYVDCIKLDCEGSEFEIVQRIASLPGGLRSRVGCIRAEVHAESTDPKHELLWSTLCEAFPYTDRTRLADGLWLVYAWR